MNEEKGKFEETDDPLKIDPLGMAIIVFLMGILIVQTIGYHPLHIENINFRNDYSSSQHTYWSFPRSRPNARDPLLADQEAC